MDGDLKQNEKLVLGGWIMFLIWILVIITTITGCKSGWSVGGLQISPSDSVSTDFMIITDQDSVKHWYVRTTVDGGILIGDNYCHKHHEWETVEKK